MLQVPRVAELIGTAIDAMVAKRPRILRFINNGAGRYADLVAGWESQCALLVRQIADEVKSARLAQADGDSLTQLASSEFQTQRQTGATFAVGMVKLFRNVGPYNGGVIPKGTRFPRPAVDGSVPPIAACLYVSSRDVSVPQGSAPVIVPVIASLAGSASNAPYYGGDNTAAGKALPTVGDKLFDPALFVGGYEAAGGSDGEDDDDLRRQAAAHATGAYGPTLGAVIAGALSGIGVHRALAFDIAELNNAPNEPLGQPAAYTGVVLADSSWGSGYGGIPNSHVGIGVWENLVAQVIADSFQGVGCQVLISGIDNTMIRLDASLVLRSGDDLKDTSEIDAAVLAAAQSYFDDRPDWYTWRKTALRAHLARAHAKILTCTSAAVRALADNTELVEPASAVIATSAGINVKHFMLASSGVTPTYTAAA